VRTFEEVIRFKETTMLSIDDLQPSGRYLVVPLHIDFDPPPSI
jgi:hypothetical protein